MLGCVRFNDPDELESVLNWMDENTDGKPYGVDIVMPAKVPTEGTSVDINKLIPQAHREFVDKTLADLGVPPLPDDEERSAGVLGWLHSVARSHVEVALKHPIKLIANALGSPPKDVIDQAHAAGVPVAALAGQRQARAAPRRERRRHRRRAGLRGRRAHRRDRRRWCCGRKSSTPLDGRTSRCSPPAASAPGGRSRRRSRSARQGVWMGSAFLTVGRVRPRRAHASRHVGDPAGAAGRRHRVDTVRRRIYTGKPARLLKSRWTDAWDAEDAPEPLPMPLQNILVSEAHQRMSESTDPTAVAMPVGQIVGPDERDPAGRRHHRRAGQGFEEATKRLDGIRDN